MVGDLGAKPAGSPPVYAALDLGTNNCRLLVAKPTSNSPTSNGFEVVDSFSRIIRLGEGVSETGRLSSAAMDRAISALEVCAHKMVINGVTRARLIATEACRQAANSEDFIAKVKHSTGLTIEIIDQKTEADLAVAGCASLIDKNSDYVLIFDIGGGSSELIWLDVKQIRSEQQEALSTNPWGNNQAIIAWDSFPVGVVTLAEKFGGKAVTQQSYDRMVGYVKGLLEGFAEQIEGKLRLSQGRTHYLGTSGTVTTLAGVHLKLDYYDRQKIDGIWMNIDEVGSISQQLINLTHEERSDIPSIGPERADLVLGGCAILRAMLEIWPTEKLRVADRGLREGILHRLMAEDGELEQNQ